MGQFCSHSLTLLPLFITFVVGINIKWFSTKKQRVTKISSKIYLGNKDVLVLCILSNTWYILVSEGLGGSSLPWVVQYFQSLTMWQCCYNAAVYLKKNKPAMMPRLPKIKHRILAHLILIVIHSCGGMIVWAATGLGHLRSSIYQNILESMWSNLSDR